VAIGGAIGLVWALSRKDAHAPLPFAPALTGGVLLYLLAAGTIT
jgi:hypothetical protein